MKSTFRPHATASSLTVWQAMKEAAVPVIAYHACAFFAFLAFSAVILFAEAGDVGGAIVILLGLGMTTLAGIVGGQLLAFLRVRTWIVVLFGVGCWIASIAVAAAGAASGLGDIGILFALALWLLPIALTGGLWSLETHRALWSAWVPLVYSVSAVIIWTEHRGSVANGFAGEKWAIWDLVSVGILGITVALLLVYLVTRETHRLALWRRGPTAPLAPTLTETGSARPRITFFGMVLLMGLAGVLTIATAAVAPYLWRTGPADREGEGEGYGQQPSEQEAPAEPPPEPGDNGFMKRVGEALQKMGEQVVEAGQKSAGSICTILTLLLLGLIGLLLGWRPLKRLFVIRHLKEPFWNVPATARIEQGWRLVEIAMGDAGVFPTAGEDAAGLARRAGPVLARLSPVEVHGLEDAAEVADRVRFGLGVGPEDLEVMQRFSGWAIDTVWERLGDREQIRCLYREL